MKKLFLAIIMFLSIGMTSCYIDEYVANPDPPVVIAPRPVPAYPTYYYWTYPRYGTPYYSNHYYRPTPPPPRPPQRPGPPPQRPPQRPNVTPRPSTPNPPTPRPSTPQKPSSTHTTTYGHR